ncbi:MAG: hypothetical protein WCP03_03355 [Candidatus Saccharibacteria bacterium]
MAKKIIGSIIILIALVGAYISVGLIGENFELGYSLMAGSLFTILVGVVIFRHGIREAVRSYSKGTPRSLR